MGDLVELLPPLADVFGADGEAGAGHGDPPGDPMARLPVCGSASNANLLSSSPLGSYLPSSLSWDWNQGSPATPTQSQ